MTKLSTPGEVKKKLPLAREEQQFILKARQIAGAIVQKKSSFAVIVGPCSIHDVDSTLEYAKLLKGIHTDNIRLFMRFHIEKPRSKGGWKGFLYDPFLDGSNRIEKGILLARKMLIELAKLKVAAATEFLDPLFVPYFSDLISWGFIGSRTSTSQIHRQLASQFDFPVGFKNTLEGDIEPVLDSVLAAKKSHTYPAIDNRGHIHTFTSKGNPYTHLVLRGSKKPNYRLSAKIGFPVMVDCSHGNSEKRAEKQNEVFRFALSQNSVFGVMIESHLFGSAQPFTNSPKYGVSLTDECLSFEDTKELILFGDRHLSSSSRSGAAKPQ